MHAENDLDNPFAPDFDSGRLADSVCFGSEVSGSTAILPETNNAVVSGQSPVSAELASQPGLLDTDSLSQIRDLAENDFYFFAKAILGLTKLNEKIHYPICQMLEKLEIDKRARILLPRGWYKTSLMTAYCLWRAVRDPEIRILYCMNTITNAISKMSSIDKHVKGNELFRKLWPGLLPTRAEKWTGECMQLKRTSAWPEGTFEAAGIRTAVVSRHYNLIVEDDTVSPDLDNMGEENVAPSKDDVSRAIGWHRLAGPLLTDQQADQICVIGTRWFEHDLLSWIKDHEAKFYKHSERAAIENEHGEADESGKPTFPEEFPTSVLEAIRASMGPYMFSCLYLNKPVRSSEMLFQPEWFQYYDMLPGDHQLVYTTTVDPGGAPEDTKGEPDWTVVLTCAKNMRTGEAFVVDFTRGKMNPGELLNALFWHVRTYKPVKVGVESVAYQKALLHWIRERSRTEQTYFSVVPITHAGKSKGLRIMGLQPSISAGLLRFKRHHQALVNELINYPYGKHDDLADALCMQLVIMPRVLAPEPATVEKPDEPEGLTFDNMIEQIHKGESRKTVVLGVISDIFRPQSKTSSRTIAESIRSGMLSNRRKVALANA